MKLYVGFPPAGVMVYTVSNGALAERRPLKKRLDLRNHSPTGFAWGYCGSGPSQLALALLADGLGDDEQALALYQDFKFALTSALPQDEPWALSDTVVRMYAAIVKQHGASVASAGDQ